jgi:penicillin-binding protein, 1A family
LGRQARPRQRRRAFIIILAFTISIAIGAMAGVVAGYFRNVPPLDEVNFDPKLTTYIYDVKGRVIARLFTENRVPVRLHEIPEVVRLAFIAAEDSDFYQHHGIDFLGIARAALVNLRAGAIEQGGSTITQQLAKLAFLTNDRTWSRKFKELLLAIQIERKYTKDEILESYLNVVYFGHGAYGVEAASQIFFQKSVSEVNLQEAALLAAIVNGPGYYSPFYDMEAATRRRNLVLRRMLDLGFIDRAAYDEAVSSPIELKDGRRQQPIAPHFVIYVREQLLDRYGAQMVYTGGLRVYTTLDLDLQRAAEKAIEEMVPVQETDENGLAQPQAALVTIDVHTGEIRAMVGGRNNDQYNRAVQATRQPGSAMKPFVYAAAIDSKRYTPAHLMVDEPTTFTLITGETWTPRNYDNTHRGTMSLRTALEDSINVVAAKLIDEIGPATAIDYAKRMGITTLQESGRLNDLTLSFALGGLTRGVTLLEMATAYGVFASGGIRTTPIAILRVEGPDGTVIDEFRPQRRLVLSPETAYIMTDMMRGVIERGTGVGANIGRPAAGKTGTTSSFTDAWFVGYTPSLVTAVWIGNDSNEPMIYPGRQIGSGTAARTWRAYMSEAVKGTPVEEFPRPPGIVGPLAIDVTNGKLVNDTCSGVPMNERVYEIFIEGTEPTEVSERCSTLFNLPNIFRRLFSSP